MAKTGKYVYCIIPTQQEISFDHAGIEADSRIYTINHGDIAAVVSDTSMTICDPIRKNMLAHNRVLEAIMREYTVLPARFGLIADSQDKLKGLLAEYYPKLKTFISMLDNRIEVGIKVFWQKEKVLAILESRDQKLTRLRQAIKESPPAKAEVLLIEAGQLVRSQVEAWQSEVGNEIYMALIRIAVDGRHNYPVDISNILNASFLLDKSKEEKFDNAVEELDKKHGHWTNIRYLKPVPPYNFVNLEMCLQ
ncbi:MAG: GvpL/GvpF family gas vesicle protein [Dehalococcoidia bacterium]|nr:GvpL/GvpF family gas vesicle protein [Dehalococcoidia bacterium]